MVRTTDEIKTRRVYKDTIFRMLFGLPEYIDNLRLLINVLYNKNYTEEDNDKIEITTMEDVIFVNVKDDISCILDDRLYLFEHQSTFNPNMPLRGFIYYAHLYDALIERSEYSIYYSKLINIPAPAYTVLCNGGCDVPARQVHHLSQAFTQEAPGFEWSAEYINLNAAENKDLLNKCKPLCEYTQVVAAIEAQCRLTGRNVASVLKAIEDCIAQGILADFLKKHLLEVKAMILTDFDEEKYKHTIAEVAREEGYEEGRAEGEARGEARGRAEGRAEGEARGVERTLLSVRESLRSSGMSDKQIENILSSVQNIDTEPIAN